MQGATNQVRQDAEGLCWRSGVLGNSGHRWRDWNRAEGNGSRGCVNELHCSKGSFAIRRRLSLVDPADIRAARRPDVSVNRNRKIQVRSKSDPWPPDSVARARCSKESGERPDAGLEVGAADRKAP